MAQATIRVAQVDRLVGTPTDAIKVHFDPEYQAFGFPPDDWLSKDLPTGELDRNAKTHVYLDFEAPVPLDPKSAGDRTGGATRPNTKLVALSRSRGPVGSQAPQAVVPALPAAKPSAAATATEAATAICWNAFFEARLPVLPRRVRWLPALACGPFSFDPAR
jgi:hypothetical protein